MMRDYSIMINRGLQGKKTGGHRIDHACEACVFFFIYSDQGTCRGTAFVD